MSFTLHLPLPPSVNALYVNVAGRGRRKSKAYRAWIAEATVWMIPQRRRAGFPRFEGQFACHIALPANMRGDCDNRLKAALDFLKEPAWIIADDSKAFDTRAFRDPTVDQGLCRITIFDAPPGFLEAA